MADQDQRQIRRVKGMVSTKSSLNTTLPTSSWHWISSSLADVCCGSRYDERDKYLTGGGVNQEGPFPLPSPRILRQLSMGYRSNLAFLGQSQAREAKV